MTDEPGPIALVVDDDATTRLLVTRTLEGFGFAGVLEAEHGRAAQELLRARPDVHIVVTDLMMPEMGGLELMRWGRVACPDALWIILSGLETFDAAAEAVRLGAFEFLTKPPQVQQLMVAVRNALEQHVLRSERARLHAELETANRELAEQVAMLERQSLLLRRDLERAEVIQRALLPQAPPALDHFCIHAVYRPGSFVGGDLYDVVPLGGQHVAMYVADATGHGVTAAMLSVLFKQRLVLFDGATGRPLSPAAVLAAANRALGDAVDAPGLFLTAAYALIDLETDTVTIASAGHPPVLHIGTGGTARLIRRSGPALGLVRDASYAEEELRLESGDRLLMFTDGLLRPGQQPDERALARTLRLHPDDPHRVLRSLLDNDAPTRDADESDDITLLLLAVHTGASRFDNGAAGSRYAAPGAATDSATGTLLYGESDAASFIALRGRVVWTHCDDFYAAGRAFQEDGRPLILDLSACDYLDSTALGTIHELVLGGGVELQRVGGAVRQAFEELSMDTALGCVRRSSLPLPELLPLRRHEAGADPRQRMLHAHEALAALSDSNRDAFRNVLDALRGDAPDR
jgi:serine phosphatase RsbU (regulator of sigma subunit)